MGIGGGILHTISSSEYVIISLGVGQRKQFFPIETFFIQSTTVSVSVTSTISPEYHSFS